MNYTVEVDGPYPCWCTIKNNQTGYQIRFTHTELLAIEHAVAEVRRQVLCKIERRNWHEIDPALALK